MNGKYLLTGCALTMAGLARLVSGNVRPASAATA